MRLTFFPATAVLALVLLLGACSSGPKIIANQDPNADFSAYKTFSFADPLSTDRQGARGILSGFLITSASAELEARGLTRSADPDLLVDFYVAAKEKLQARSQPSSVGYAGAYGHRGYGGYGTWAGYNMSTSTTTVTSTVEGTVAIDIIDPKLGQVVWEAAATGRVTEKVQDNLDTAVPAVVAEMFQRYPMPLPKQTKK